MTAASKKVLVGGCFDILHYGHFVFLQHARTLGDHLSVILESDEHILHHKHRPPVHTQAQRCTILSHLRIVDEVIPIPFFTTFDEYLSLVQRIHPHIIAVTAGDPQLANKKAQAEQIGAVVKIVTPLLTGFSTTEIMRRLCA
jgi:cytidyltransferase-like protein